MTINPAQSLCSTGNILGLLTTEPTPVNDGNIVRSLAPSFLEPVAVQPVNDVQEYLCKRAPQPDPEKELALFLTVPMKERDEVNLLLCAFNRVKSRALTMSVSRACADVLAQERFAERGWAPGTFRRLYDKFVAERDWVVLVNRSKCQVAWRATSVGLPERFLEFCAQRFGEFKREDGKRQALLSIKRQWRTGRNDDCKDEVIPGYEEGWSSRVRELFPTGWSYSNILRQIKGSGKFTKGVRALLHEGEAAARSHLPQVLGSRAGLRFLEKITFDDVRTDWLIRNPKTGKAEELWLLVARDEATAMVLGFV